MIKHLAQILSCKTGNAVHPAGHRSAARVLLVALVFLLLGLGAGLAFHRMSMNLIVNLDLTSAGGGPAVSAACVETASSIGQDFGYQVSSSASFREETAVPWLESGMGGTSAGEWVEYR